MSTFSCPACGQVFAFRPEFVGKQVRCQKCSNVFPVPNPDVVLEAPMVEPVAGQPSSRQPAGYGRKSPSADVIDYEIFGDDMQYVEVTLDPGEVVIAEAGMMMFLSQGIKMDTVFGDPSQQNQGFFGKMLSAGKRVLTGESMFMTIFTNVAQRREMVAFAAPYPGKIVPLHLDQLGGEMICQKDSFLC